MSDQENKKRFKLDGFTVVLGIIVVALVLFLPLQSLSTNDDVAVIDEDVAESAPEEQSPLLVEEEIDETEAPDSTSGATSQVYYDEYNPYAMQVRIEAALERLEAMQQNLNSLRNTLLDLHTRASEQTEYFNNQVEGDPEPEE